MRRKSKGLTKRAVKNVALLERNARFGVALEAARLLAHKSTKALAAAVGTTARHIMEIEDGDRPPLSFAQIERAATFLGCDARLLTDAALTGAKRR